MNWKKLQNGSDIRGVALEGIEGENVNLTEEVIMTIGKSFVCWLRKTMGVENPTIAVGMDCRLSGNAIKGAFIKGAAEDWCQRRGLRLGFYSCHVYGHHQRHGKGYGFGYGDSKPPAV